MNRHTVRERDLTLRPRRLGAASGQAVVLLAVSLTVLCAALAIGVDVGLTGARYNALRGVAESAGNVGAHLLYGRQLGLNHADDAAVWSAMAGAVALEGLTVVNASSAQAPADPCSAGYKFAQVALSASYVDRQNAVIDDMTGSPVMVGGGTLPSNAWGVQVSVGGCQPAAFGAIIGHPRYTIWSSGASGQPLQGATSTPGTPTSTAPATATSLPTATSTAGPSSTPNTCPSGWSCGDISP